MLYVAVDTPGGATVLMWSLPASEKDAVFQAYDASIRVALMTGLNEGQGNSR